MIAGIRRVVVGLAALSLGGAATSASALTPDQLPRGDYETYWRQVGGNWLSDLAKTTIQGCAAPASACGAVPGGPFLAGRTIGFRAHGCAAPPITIQCVVQKAGLGRPGAAKAKPATSGPALVSGRYVMRTTTGTGIVALSVSGTTVSGSVDWNLPGRRQDPIFAGRIRGDRIGFTLLCGAQVTCVQRFVGTVAGDEASGTWTGRGATGPTAWTLRRR